MSAPPRPSAPASAGVTLDAMEVNQVRARRPRLAERMDAVGDVAYAYHFLELRHFFQY